MALFFFQCPGRAMRTRKGGKLKGKVLPILLELPKGDPVPPFHEIPGP